LKVVDAVRLPLVAVMVTGVSGAATAVIPANSSNRTPQTVEVPQLSIGANVPITPAGKPEKVNLILPVNPPE
jgi:hypothetical protein